MNQYAEGARLVKVFKLANAFERELRDAAALWNAATDEDHPVDAGLLAIAADNFNDWAALARKHDVNPPSTETIRLVKFFLHKRAEETAHNDPFTGLP